MVAITDLAERKRRIVERDNRHQGLVERYFMAYAERAFAFNNWSSGDEQWNSPPERRYAKKEVAVRIGH